MRTVLAVGLAVVMLFVGVQAIGVQAGQSEAVAQNDSNASAAAWNMSEEVYSGGATATGPAVVWMGVGAIVVVALGLLVGVGRGR